MPPKKGKRKRRVGRPCKSQQGQGLGKSFKRVVRRVGRTAQKVNRFARKNKVISRGLTAGAVLAGVAGRPDLGMKLGQASKVASQLGYGLNLPGPRPPPIVKMKMPGQ